MVPCGLLDILSMNSQGKLNTSIKNVLTLLFRLQSPFDIFLKKGIINEEFQNAAYSSLLKCQH